MNVWLLISIFSRNREKLRGEGKSLPSLGEETSEGRKNFGSFFIVLLSSGKENCAIVSARVDNYLGSTRVPSMDMSQKAIQT